MAITLRSFRYTTTLAAALLATSAFACSDDGDDKKTETGNDDANDNDNDNDDDDDDDTSDGGAAPIAPSYPPALQPQDCAKSTSDLTLSQPSGAAVWGGLVTVEFTVEGAKVDQFDVQLYDPSRGAWTVGYVSQDTLQRDDGTYVMALTPSFTPENQDEELKVRVRPQQSGCPDADWKESAGFTSSDPVVDTKWKATIPAVLFNGDMNVQRTKLPEMTSLPNTRFTLGDVTVELAFGKKGAYSQVLTLPLVAKKNEPFNACTLVLSFSGSYTMISRKNYGGISLAISEQKLSSTKGSTCAAPTIADLAISLPDAVTTLPAYAESFNIDYTPLLNTEPGAPTWQNSNLGQVFNQLAQFFAYTSATESGDVNGNFYPQEVEFERQ